MENIIEISNLEMQYSEESGKVLQGLDFSVRPGEIIGYIGPNGAGKTTTLKIILGMITDFKGKVRIFGEEIKSDDPDYKYKIGYVPENGEIYEDLTAFEYLDFLGKIYKLDESVLEKRITSMISAFGLFDNLHNRITSFSKGMKQKLLIIGALIHNPEIIFLDEPLNGLDANSVKILKELLARLSEQGKTIFYSSHLMDIVEKISDRIILLKDGRIIADDSFEELQRKSEQGTLEDIFNNLTDFNQSEEIADDIVLALGE